MTEMKGNKPSYYVRYFHMSCYYIVSVYELILSYCIQQRKPSKNDVMMSSIA
jgi:hypothetical protein